jgi:hypothetical protein
MAREYFQFKLKTLVQDGSRGRMSEVQPDSPDLSGCFKPHLLQACEKKALVNSSEASHHKVFLLEHKDLCADPSC